MTGMIKGLRDIRLSWAIRRKKIDAQSNPVHFTTDTGPEGLEPVGKATAHCESIISHGLDAHAEGWTGYFPEFCSGQ